MRLNKRLVALAALVGAVAAITTIAFAVSNAHFVGTPTATRDDTTLTMSGKVAGLGDVENERGELLGGVPLERVGVALLADAGEDLVAGLVEV